MFCLFALSETRKQRSQQANIVRDKLHYNVAPTLEIPWLTLVFVAVQGRKESCHVMTAKARAHRSILNLQKWKG